MNMKIKLLQSTRQIQKEIERASAQELEKRIKRNSRRAEAQIKAVIPSWVSESPEIASLTAEGQQGSLNAQFGFFPGTSQVIADSIAQSIADNTRLELKFGKSLSSISATLLFQPANYANLLSLPLAEIVTEKGEFLPWLKSLLLDGASTIVTGFEYVPDNTGRSGGGSMKGGSAWRIPPQFAGSAENNFVTRVFVGRNKAIQSILQGMLS